MVITVNFGLAICCRKRLAVKLRVKQKETFVKTRLPCLFGINIGLRLSENIITHFQNRFERFPVGYPMYPHFVSLLKILSSKQLSPIDRFTLRLSRSRQRELGGIAYRQRREKLAVGIQPLVKFPLRKECIAYPKTA